ncbi:MAG TPA: Lpg1974 family pore-forming outer membrane protein [Rhizomicrobium sp.]|nr:Lpg1974 family pore-forming outer membrane protein [Rhizomicrobium sp.]
MSELNPHIVRRDFRRQLLNTVSALALIGVVAAGHAKAADGEPLMWIELGGEYSQANIDQDVFLPPFLSASKFGDASQTSLQKPPRSSWDGTAKISFALPGSDWMLSASVLYGKNSKNKSQELVTANPTSGGFNYNAYQDHAAKSSESHTVLDFQVGRDFGLGMFGSSSTSRLSVGLRYAQFNSRNSINIQSQPTNANYFYHRFYASFAADRKFIGVGPSLAWEASANLLGNPSAGHFTFDWGANGAVLFGRQRIRAHHQVTDDHTTFSQVQQHRHIVYDTSVSPSRNRNTIVPDLGGFAGVSWCYPNAKVSVGYRGDFFFGAMDGGIDAARRENVGFYGPFASVSVGLGG